MKLEHIYLSPGHNFFGHHGQPAGTHPIAECDTAGGVAGRGLRGDRFFDYRENYKGQVTLVAAEVFEELCDALGLAGVSPAAMRRNLVVRGGNLDTLIGREFELQGVKLAGVEECKPCYWMDQALGPGAEMWLRGRGGLRCRVLTNGWLHRED